MSTQKVILSSDTQRRVRIAVFLYFFFVGLCSASWASRIPDIKSLFSMSNAEWGVVLLMIPVGQIVSMSFSGWLISKIGSNKVLLIAIICYALSLFLIGYATTETLLISALISFGFFWNFCNIAMNTQAVIAENYYSRPIMASFHGGWSSAGLCGGLIGLTMTIFDIPTVVHFSLTSAVAICGAIINYKYLQFDATKKCVDRGDSVKSDKKMPFETFLLWFGIIGFFAWATEGTMADWNGIYLQEIVGVSDKITPLGLTAYMVAMTIGRFLMDRATSRWGRRMILCFSGAAIFTGMAIAVLIPTLVATIIGYMIVGFGACGVIPALYSATGELTKMHTGRAITILSTISFAGFLIGPPMIGYISEITNLRYSFALIGIFGLASWIISHSLKVLRKA